MQWIGKENKTIANKPIRCEHRCGAPTHRPATDQKMLRAKLVASSRNYCCDAVFELRHRVGPTHPLFSIEEIETNNVKTEGAIYLRDPRDSAVGHVSTCAMRADEHGR